MKAKPVIISAMTPLQEKVKIISDGLSAHSALIKEMLEENINLSNTLKLKMKHNKQLEAKIRRLQRDFIKLQRKLNRKP